MKRGACNHLQRLWTHSFVFIVVLRDGYLVSEMDQVVSISCRKDLLRKVFIDSLSKKKQRLVAHKSSEADCWVRILQNPRPYRNLHCFKSFLALPRAAAPSTSFFDLIQSLTACNSITIHRVSHATHLSRNIWSLRRLPSFQNAPYDPTVRLSKKWHCQCAATKTPSGFAVGHKT